MSKIKLTDEDLNKISNSSSKSLSAQKVSSTSDDNYKKLLQELDDIQSKYEFPMQEKTLVDTNISLERKSMPQIDESAINKQAENELKSYKLEGEKAINSQNELAKSNLENQISSARESANTSRQSTNSYYDNAKQQAENDALKRGLSRSSIIINTLAAFDANRIEKLNQIDKALTSQIQNLNDQIDVLNLEKQKALDDFNIDYATKLNNKISELKSDLTKRQDEVTEYNNKIAQIEAEYKRSATKDNNEIIGDSYSELTDKIKLMTENEDVQKAVEKESYRAVLNFLNSLEPEEAYSFIRSNDFLRQKLGSQYSAVLAYYRQMIG